MKAESWAEDSAVDNFAADLDWVGVDSFVVADLDSASAVDNFVVAALDWVGVGSSVVADPDSASAVDNFVVADLDSASAVDSFVVDWIVDCSAVVDNFEVEPDWAD